MKKSKVLLFTPNLKGMSDGVNRIQPSLGLLLIAPILEQNGHDVKIYDAALENGASGGKLTGAGGGGHMLFYCEKSKHDGFIQKMEDIGLKHIRFKFNNDGPKVLNLYDYSGK